MEAGRSSQGSLEVDILYRAQGQMETGRSSQDSLEVDILYRAQGQMEAGSPSQRSLAAGIPCILDYTDLQETLLQTKFQN